MSPHQIAAQIEDIWTKEWPVAQSAAFTAERDDKLDAYVAWLSEHWQQLSESDRRVLIAGGAALFDARLKHW